MNILEYKDPKNNINIGQINLYSLIDKNYRVNINHYEIEIAGKIYNFFVEKQNNIVGYKIIYEGKTIFLNDPILINFKINNSNNFLWVYSIENLINIINNSSYIFPYIIYYEKIIKIEMDYSNIEDIYKKIIEGNDKTIYDDNKEYIAKFILTQCEFSKNELMKLPNYIDKIRNEIMLPKYFGKYTKYYISDLKDDDNLLSINSNNINRIASYIGYNDQFPVFEFITGAHKSGKTFATLYNLRYNYYTCIYFNIKIIYGLENKNNYDEIKNIFFYEISRYFMTYAHYTGFLKLFLKKSKIIYEQSFSFLTLLNEFIQYIEIYIKNNISIYNGLQIIIDDLELDEKEKIRFKYNIDFIIKLYNERRKESVVHFLIISPLNENYIKTCIILGLKLIKNNYKDEFTKKDENTGVIFYPFIFIGNCFFYNDNEFKNYKERLFEENDVLKYIPQKYADSVKYSKYHLNNIQLIYKKDINRRERIKEVENYIEQIQNKGYKKILSFYEGTDGDADIELKITKYDLDKIKEYKDSIDREVDIDILINMLLFLPIEIITFDKIPCTNKLNFFKKIYKVTYLYKVYEKLISKYLDMFESPDYNENKNIKQGTKGDILEKKVISSINNNYFKNFQPTEIIEVNSIFNIAENYNKNEILKEAEDIKSALDKVNNNLIMIIQKYPNAKRYDIAFIQIIDRNNGKFILGQITSKKEKYEMTQYINVKSDCYKFSNFFSFHDIKFNIVEYHFFFIFQGGIGEDKKSMTFCNQHNIKYFKFYIKNKIPYFSDSNNNIIYDIIFDKNNYSLVEDIINNKSSIYKNILRKIKRENPLIAAAKFKLGINIYNKAKNIIKKDFQLSKEFYSLEENKYFYIGKKINENNTGNNKIIYYLKYIFEENEIVIDLLNNKNKFLNDKEEKKYYNEIKSEFKKPGIILNCFRIIN